MENPKNRDVVSFIHGVINLVWPIFAYELAALAALSVSGYGWTSMLPMTIMLLLPIFSSLVGAAIAAVRYYRRQNVMALLGLMFDIVALALYWFLRVQLHFTLGWFDENLAVWGIF